MFELMDTHTQSAVIKVIGVGGGGGNAVNHMMESSIEGVDFISANTDAQALKHSTVKTILQLGAAITKGLGAGANPSVGRQAAEEDPPTATALLMAMVPPTAPPTACPMPRPRPRPLPPPRLSKGPPAAFEPGAGPKGVHPHRVVPSRAGQAGASGLIDAHAGRCGSCRFGAGGRV